MPVNRLRAAMNISVQIDVSQTKMLG